MEYILDKKEIFTFTPDKMKSFCERHPNSLIAFYGEELTPQQRDALNQQVIIKKALYKWKERIDQN